MTIKTLYKNILDLKVRLIFGLICVMIACVLLFIRLNSTGVTIDLTCDYLTLNLEQDFTSNDILSAKRIAIKYLDEVRSPFSGVLDSSQDKSSQFEAASKRISLKKISMNNKGELSVRLNKNRVEFFVKGSNFNSVISLADSSTYMVNRNSVYKHFTIPEDIYFRADDLRMVPSYIKFEGVNDFQLQGLSINTVSFFEEKKSSIFKSTIQNGTIRLHNIPLIIQLYDKDHLLLGKVKSEKVAIYQDGNYKLRFLFVGTVGKLMVGPENFEKDLRPSLLQYFYYNETLKLLLTIIIALWPFFWGLKKLMTEKQ